MKLGQRLVKKRIIDEDQLGAVLARQRDDSARLGEMLVRLGLASKRDILSCLAAKPGFVLDSVTLAQIQPEVVKLIPRRIAERLNCIATKFENECLSVAMADPLDFNAVEQVGAISGSRVEPLLAGASDIDLAIRLHYAVDGERSIVLRPSTSARHAPHHDTTLAHATAGDEDDDAFGLVSAARVSSSLRVADPGHLDAEGGDMPTSVHLQNLLLHEALCERASDIHIEPRADHLCVRNRIDGRLIESQVLPKWMHGGLVSRFKVLAQMDIAERRMPQDGRCRIQVDGKHVDVRVSTLPTRHGEKVVLRILDRNNEAMELEELGLSGSDLSVLEDFVDRPQGMVLVVGPTGSGKTTTLYSMIRRVDSAAQNVITIEDPIEYEIPTINQVQVQEKIGFEFATVLRSVLRQDPDVVLLGEIRDEDTAQVAVRAALTGHLLMSTLHTNNAVGTLTRLLDLGIAPFLLSTSLLGIVSQRLVRRTCPSCAAPYTPNRDALRVLGLADSGRYLRGRGCDACSGRGSKGRIAVFELLRVTDRLRRAICRNAGEQELRRIAADSGMSSLCEAGAELVRGGVATAEDVATVVRDIDWTETCRQCDRPVEPDFEACPQCGVDLRAACPGCSHTIQPDWRTCPYCRTDLPRSDLHRARALPAPGEGGVNAPLPPIRALRSGRSD